MRERGWENMTQYVVTYSVARERERGAGEGERRDQRDAVGEREGVGKHDAARCDVQCGLREREGRRRWREGGRGR